MRGTQTALISGAGIAGPALAFWLDRFGMTPTIVERAPGPRTGGYVIDFWGAGYDIADRMGVVPAIRAAGYKVRELRIVDARGRRVGGFGVDVFRRITRGRYTSVARSALAGILLDAVRDRCAVRFRDSVARIEEAGDGVDVGFESGATERFDLVVGCDGLHSGVRSIVFGPQERFERRLGYTVAAFEVGGYPRRDEDVYLAFSAPGVQVARFAMRDDRTLVLVVARSDRLDVESHAGREAHERAIERAIGGLGWECGAIVDAMRRAPDVYLDRVSQIVMPSWSAGRVALVGDAACCPSLLAGQGSALAMVGAYVLAGEVARSGGDHRAAFARYEAMLRPFIEKKQRSARGFGGAFAPKTPFGVWFRNLASRACNVPGVGRWMIGRSLRDDLELPAYPEVRDA